MVMESIYRVPENGGALDNIKNGADCIMNCPPADAVYSIIIFWTYIKAVGYDDSQPFLCFSFDHNPIAVLCICPKSGLR